MKIITCASFYGSGSSAISDLVGEYDTVRDLSEYEFRIPHDIDGISDLEFHLCECHNRHNSGHALKRFMRLAHYYEGNRFVTRCEPLFHNQFGKLTDEYVRALTDFQYRGGWFYDFFDYGIRHYYFMQAINKVLGKLTRHRKNLFQRETTYCSHPTAETFLTATRAYLAALMRAANPEGLPYLQIDQIVPSQNIGRILRYFSDPVDVFLVDRDPRDIYTLEKLYWRERVVPDSPELFSRWYRYTRQSGTEPVDGLENVHRLHFEDLIFDYDRQVARIEEATGLSSADHTQRFVKFNPKRSVHNTQVWKKHPELAPDIARIEAMLPEYLYDFSAVDPTAVAGVEPETTGSF